jgi:YggT family protein
VTTAPNFLALIIYGALTIFIVTMWIRFVLDLISTYSRAWRPRGFALVLAELVYTITDPPVKFVRRFIKPVRIGSVMLDFSWSIVLLSAIILSYITLGFMN